MFLRFCCRDHWVGYIGYKFKCWCFALSNLLILWDFGCQFYSEYLTATITRVLSFLMKPFQLCADSASIDTLNMYGITWPLTWQFFHGQRKWNSWCSFWYIIIIHNVLICNWWKRGFFASGKGINIYEHCLD